MGREGGREGGGGEGGEGCEFEGWGVQVQPARVFWGMGYIFTLHICQCHVLLYV